MQMRNNTIQVRRDHLYADAFDQLSPRGQALQQGFRVQMVDEHVRSKHRFLLLSHKRAGID
jgi:hypothetical protein